MLTTGEVLHHEDPTLEFDYYIMVEARWPGNYRSGIPLYLYVRSLAGFFELGFDPSTRQIVEFLVLMLDRVRLIDAAHPPVPVDRALTCELALPPSGATPAKQDIVTTAFAEAYLDRLKLTLFPGEESRYCGSEPVTFGFGTDNVVRSVSFDWTVSERAEFIAFHRPPLGWQFSR